MPGSTWKVCACDHYQTRHRMPELWEFDQERQECFVKGCRCELYQQVWVSKKNRNTARREMHRRLRKARTERERKRREQARQS